MVYCDANVVLRYLLNDNAEQFVLSSEIIENEDVFILNEVTAEIVYVLLKVYSVEKKKVCSVLKRLFRNQNFYFSSKEVILKALDLFSGNALDYVDCILCAYSIVGKRDIFSFDKKLLRVMKREKVKE